MSHNYVLLAQGHLVIKMNFFPAKSPEFEILFIAESALLVFFRPQEAKKNFLKQKVWNCVGKL